MGLSFKFIAIKFLSRLSMSHSVMQNHSSPDDKEFECGIDFEPFLRFALSEGDAVVKGKKEIEKRTSSTPVSSKNKRVTMFD